MIGISNSNTIGGLPANLSGGGGASGLVTEGLILNLDSTDTSSYSGTGTVWTDLSGEGNHFDLVNGPTYSTDDGGTIITDGGNDYIKSQGNIDEVNAANSTFAYVKCYNLRTSQWAGQYFTQFVSKGFNNSVKSNINIRYYVTTGNWSTYGYASVQVWVKDSSGNNLAVFGGWDEATVPQISEGQWYYVGFTTDGVSGNNITVYVNGVSVGTATLSGNRSIITSEPMVVSSDAWSRNFGMPGANRNYHMYNRELSDAEVLQNYEAIKI